VCYRQGLGTLRDLRLGILVGLLFCVSGKGWTLVPSKWTFAAWPHTAAAPTLADLK
jgi:hypothetical protein